MILITLLHFFLDSSYRSPSGTLLLELKDIDIDIHERDEDGRSSIILASRKGHVNIVELLLSKGANINDISNDGSTAISLSSSDKIKYILRKWPISMVILVLNELTLYCAGIDNDFLIDLYQYMGREDFTADNDFRGDNNSDSDDVGDEEDDDDEEEEEEDDDDDDD